MTKPGKGGSSDTPGKREGLEKLRERSGPKFTKHNSLCVTAVGRERYRGRVADPCFLWGV